MSSKKTKTTKTGKKQYIDTIGSSVPDTSDYSKTSNKIFHWKLESAQKRAEKKEYAVVGVWSRDKAGNENKEKKSNTKRTLRTAMDNIWYPDPEHKNADRHVKDGKTPEARFVGIIPYAAWRESFPDAYREGAKYEETDFETDGLDAWISGLPKAIVKTFKLNQLVPPGTPDDEVLAFVDKYAVWGDVVNEESDNYNANKAKLYQALLEETPAKEKKGVKSREYDVDEVMAFYEIGKVLRIGQTSKIIKVIDANGAKVCMFGEAATRNVENVATKLLDRKKTSDLSVFFSTEDATKSVNVSDLAPGLGSRASSANYDAKAQKKGSSATSLKRPLGLALTFLDKDGKTHDIRANLFVSKTKAGAEALIGELKHAKRDGEYIYNSAEGGKRKAFDETLKGALSAWLVKIEEAAKPKAKKVEKETKAPAQDILRGRAIKEEKSEKKSKKSQEESEEEASEEESEERPEESSESSE